MSAATPCVRLGAFAGLALEAAFDGGRLTSDGGFAWLRRADDELGLCEGLASHATDWRNRRPDHPLVEPLRQRIYQMTCGYEDQNDSNSLRADPLLKMVCGALPESGKDLASQPSAGWRTRLMLAPATGWPVPWWSCTSLSAARTALRQRCFWTSTPPTIPPTEIGREPLPWLL